MVKSASKISPRTLAHLIAQSAYDVKAEEIEVLDLRKLAAFTDFFVIATGRSDRQVRAIADRIDKNLSAKKKNPLGIEGYQQGHWILIDYGDVVAHIFYEETKAFYALDRLWGDAPRIRFRLK